MATATADAIADLQALLRTCCQELEQTSPAEVVSALEGPPPPLAEDDGVFEGTGASDPQAVLDGQAGPRWRPLLVGLPPGVEQLVGIVKPPLDVLVALLNVVAALLEILKALLLALPDPFLALLEAAYQALKAIIDDLLAAGVYLYADAPGLTSPQVSAAELGFEPDLATAFELGRAQEPAPLVQPNGFAQWAGRFRASFDDAGDDERPVLSDGATVEAVFVVGAAPTLELLSRFAYLLGVLFNLAAFKEAVDFEWASEDPPLSRIRGQKVAPNWHSRTLEELFPPLKHLERLPEMLKGLLLKVESVVGMLADLASAIQAKVELLRELAELVQDIIDLLDALSGMGLYTLAVATNEGVDGLVQAFESAADRPEGGYVAGACMLAAGPGLADATVLWEMFAGGGFTDAAKQAWGTLEDAGQMAEDAGAELVDTAGDAWEAMSQAVRYLPQDTVDALGRRREELVEMVHNAPDELYALLEDAKEVHVDDAIRQGRERARALGESGEAVLGLYAEELDRQEERARRAAEREEEER